MVCPLYMTSAEILPYAGAAAMMDGPLRRSNHAEPPRAQRAGLCLTQGVWLLAATLFIGCQRSSDASKAPSAAVDSIQRVTEKGPVRLTVRVSPASPPN